MRFEIITVEQATELLLRQNYFVRHLRYPSVEGGFARAARGDLMADVSFMGLGAGFLPNGADYRCGQWYFQGLDEAFSKPNPKKYGQTNNAKLYSPVVYRRETSGGHPGMEVRIAGDRYVLVEYGDMVLNIAYRVRVHWLEKNLHASGMMGDPFQGVGAITETAPGVRSLQIRYDFLKCPLAKLLELILHCDELVDRAAKNATGANNPRRLPCRVLYLPVDYDSKGCHEAMAKYRKGIRNDAPYLNERNSNIEYIMRNNGLKSEAEVEEKFFASSFMCLGLGDVYLGASCAVAVNPLHRMITSKMNPARIWTEEGTVGLGGAYMCIYPMYSPGGYQLVGRTLPIWCNYAGEENPLFTRDRPWLLDMFDQVPWLLDMFDHRLLIVVCFGVMCVAVLVPL